MSYLAYDDDQEIFETADFDQEKLQSFSWKKQNHRRRWSPCLLITDDDGGPNNAGRHSNGEYFKRSVSD